MTLSTGARRNSEAFVAGTKGLVFRFVTGSAKLFSGHLQQAGVGATMNDVAGGAAVIKRFMDVRTSEGHLIVAGIAESLVLGGQQVGVICAVRIVAGITAAAGHGFMQVTLVQPQGSRVMAEAAQRLAPLLQT
jgi:hypothetical protein